MYRFTADVNNHDRLSVDKYIVSIVIKWNLILVQCILHNFDQVCTIENIP